MVCGVVNFVETASHRAPPTPGHQGRKSDIYSFGVLLLELVTGRRMADEGDRLVTECRALFSDLTIKAADYTDPRLCDHYPERFARGLAIVAWHCVADDKWRQPDIESILEKLKFLVEMCERDGEDMAAEAAALEVGGLGLVKKGNAEANGGEERSSADVAPSAGQRITIAGKSARVVAVPASRIVATAASNPDAVSASKRSFLKKAVGAAAVGLPPLVLGGKAMAEGEQQAVASSRMSYSRFLEYLDMDRVKKVDLYENGTIAIVEAVSPELGNRIQRVRVQLPGLSGELLAKFREKNIDFAAHNPQEDSGAVFMNVLGNLAFPLLLVGGLFLLSRRSQGMGPGGPGGPMAFGQSKAKFQMEPNTGVTFNDVAGVDEAKQDFMEVVEFLKRPERFTAVGARIPKGCAACRPARYG
ncbi:unnamed protein product [Closterium sp. NIES-65]|nr:unnamed protein product [Closterium sp. NIES-65]